MCVLPIWRLTIVYVSCNAAGPALKKYGHLRVQSLLAREAFPPHFQGSPLLAQFSSLGSLDERWLTNEFRGSLSAGLTSSRGQPLALLPLPQPDILAVYAIFLHGIHVTQISSLVGILGRLSHARITTGVLCAA